MVEVLIKLNEVITYIFKNICTVKYHRIICGFQCMVNHARQETRQCVDSVLIYIVFLSSQLIP